MSGLYKVAFKLVQIVTGIELPCEVDVGRNFVIDHFGGIIISGYARATLIKPVFFVVQ